MPPPLSVIGVNHRTASGMLRERLAAEEAEAPAILARLRGLGFGEVLWLSTCDRSEIWFVQGGDGLDAAALGFLAGRAGLAVADLAAEAAHLTGAAALRHIFAVAAALESQLIGEPHVLGQVKAAHRQAAAAGLVGTTLEHVLQAAYAVAKRTRSETALTEGATSIVAAAVQVARDLHGDLDRCAALLLGIGDMGLMIVEGLQAAGLGRVAATAPLERRAQTAARRCGGQIATWDDLPAALAQADIVVSACCLGRHVIDRAMVAAAVKQRRRRPVFLVDAAVPGDIDPAAGDIDEAYLYDLNDLEGVALAGRAGREAARQAATALVDDAAAAFIRDRAERGAVPAVAALRAHFEAERRRVLAEHGGLDAGAATRLLVNRLLHRPSAALRELAAAGGADGAAAERLAARLFGLADADEEKE